MSNAKEVFEGHAVLNEGFMSGFKNWTSNNGEPFYTFNRYFTVRGYRVTAVVTLDNRKNKHLREYYVSYSFCSKKDQFSRKIGRDKARQTEGFMMEISVANPQHTKAAVTHDVMNHWAAAPNCPDSLRRR